MRPEITAIEAELAGVLDRCAEHIEASMAALYVSQEGQPYELVTSYGFQIPPRKQVGGNDVVIERMIMRRAAFFVNGASSDPRLYDLLYHWNSNSILVAPLYSQGQLVGFIDMRDKANKKPFTSRDFPEAKEIVKGILAVFSQHNLFGQSASSTSPGAVEISETHLPVAKIIERAESVIDRQLLHPHSSAKTLSDQETAPAILPLTSMLALPGSVLACLSVFGHLGNVQQIASRGPLSDETLARFDEKLNVWLKKQGVLEGSNAIRRNVVIAKGDIARPIAPTEIISVLTAPVVVGSMSGLALSVAFNTAPDRPTRAALENYLELLQQTLDHSIRSFELRMSRQRIAEKLLEPDFQRFPELADHSRRVSDVAEQFASSLGMSAEAVETIRVAAFLHDVGARLLDYSRLYNKANFNDDDKELLKRHPVIGAALIADSPLGNEIATIVLYHHERADGKGYPYGLAGEQIPKASSIVHLCEAFDAMTSLHSYQPPIPETAALTQIRRFAGSQFDKELANKFCDMFTRASAFGME